MTITQAMHSTRYVFPLTGILFLVGCISVGCSQDANTSSTEQLDTIRKHHGLPGLIAGHFTLDGDLELEVSGVRKSGSREALQEDDPMHLGSCTKSMTAVLIGLLVDEGKLRWDSTLAEVFDDDETVKSSAWADTTVSQLLHHVSGAVTSTPWTTFNDPSIPVTQQRRRVLHWMMKQPRNAASVGQFTYSNLGYMVLGHIVEEIRQQSWEEEIQQRLFDPLDIKSAGFGPPSLSKGPDVPWGHTNLAGVTLATELDNPPVLGPAGTTHMSMKDWVKYLRLHLVSDAEGADASDADALPIPIRRETLRFLHTPGPKEGYAGGWIVSERPWAGGRILTHNGSNTVWYCVVFLAPEQKRGIFSASNYGLGSAKACDEALQSMLRTHPAPGKP
jgi:CubicO group peptidase (beta-lactamase class C family)